MDSSISTPIPPSKISSNAVNTSFGKHLTEEWVGLRGKTETCHAEGFMFKPLISPITFLVLCNQFKCSLSIQEFFKKIQGFTPNPSFYFFHTKLKF
jgi:hypothetical protein